MTTENGQALVLAAGRGTRMRSKLAKVLHPVLGRPMVHYPIVAAHQAGLAVWVVVHHQEDAVRTALNDYTVGFVRQEQTRGTGDAVCSGLAVLPLTGVVVVMNGDAPLLRVRALQQLLEAHGDGDHLVTVLTVALDDPGSYGRIIRSDGEVQIVEAANATPEQLEVREINSGIYAFDIAWLREVLPTLPSHPPKGEVYLTDTVALASALGRAQAICYSDPEEVSGVNDRWELALASEVLQSRILADIARSGVTIEHPASTVIEAGVTVGADATIAAGAVLRGSTTVGEGAVVGAHAVLIDAVVGDGAVIGAGQVCRGVVVPAGASLLEPA